MKSLKKIYIKVNKFSFFEITTFFLLFISLLLLKELNYLFYDTFNSPDFEKYRVYFDYFLNNNIPNREHGLLYYYLHSYNYYLFYSEFENYRFFIHKSVQEVNFYIYIFGLIGYYKLLNYFDFNKSSIFLTFSFLNFFPPAIAMRLAFKPEILAFSLLPWILFFLENFQETKKTRYLYFVIPFLVGCVSLKGNVLVIVLVYLSLGYLKNLFVIFNKKVFFVVIIFISLLFFVLRENKISNGLTIFDVQSGATEETEYNFKATPSVIYNVNLFKLFTSPIKHNHANSFISITLLETNGDYFDLFWDNNASGYSESRRELFSFQYSDKISIPQIDRTNKKIIFFQQRMTDVYLKETIGFVMSITIFIMLFRAFIFDKDNRYFYFAIFLGMIIILFHSITGIPNNNFNPNLGDTFKPLYYSFVFLLSIVFVIVKNFDQKTIGFVSLLLYFILIIFIIGFPKVLDYDLALKIAPMVENSKICGFEKNIFFSDIEDFSIDCINNSTKSLEEITKSKFNHRPANAATIFMIIIVSFLSNFKSYTRFSKTSSRFLRIKNNNIYKTKLEK